MSMSMSGFLPTRTRHALSILRSIRSDSGCGPDKARRECGGYAGQPLGRGRCGGQHQLDHRTRGFGRQHQSGGGQFADHILANLFGHLRCAVDPGVDQGMATAHIAQGRSALDVVVEPTS